MPARKPSPQERIDLHKDGSVRARGQMLDGKLTGSWEWFRKDGTRLRSGHFERGEQVGEWTTYDQRGAVYKVTVIGPPAGTPAGRLIDERIRDLGGWRGETLARMRALILSADPAITEEWKWSNPVWSHDGIVCTGEAYTKVVKLTFANGADIADPSQLFNSSLAGNTRRAIDIHEGEQLNARAFQALVKAAVARNGAPAKASRTSTVRPASAPKARAKSRSGTGKTRPAKLRKGG